MVSGRLRSVIRVVRAVAGTDDGTSADGLLLRRFITNRDESAFAALVERHGAMVFGVCRRVLNNISDAEDAYQAAFVVLACKARAISRPELLGSWLYRVAFRAALRARAEASRRREHPLPSADIAVAPPIPDADWADLRPVLDEEIERLPQKYRLPVVLCYLEGHSNDEAARRLGCPLGTIASRLATARERLRGRLMRRGITLSSSLLASVLAVDALSATVPGTVCEAAITSALAFTSGAALSGAAATSSILLAKGVLRSMLLSRIRTVFIVLAILGLVGIGGGYLATQPGADARPQDRPPALAAGDDVGAKRVAELLKLRRDAAEAVFEFRIKKVEAGAALADEAFFACSLRLHQAELDLCRTRAERVEACTTHMNRMNRADQILQAQFQAGKINIGDGAVGTYYRADAELRLERAKAK
jgi:RNA polymerase sigma factor (sigma-70 family)